MHTDVTTSRIANSQAKEAGQRCQICRPLKQGKEADLSRHRVIQRVVAFSSPPPPFPLGQKPPQIVNHNGQPFSTSLRQCTSVRTLGRTSTTDTGRLLQKIDPIQFGTAMQITSKSVAYEAEQAW